MVLKPVHRNKAILNTGNTVKCANSSYVQQYIRQGTVVKTVTASEEGETADYNVDQAELAPGVVYSLNKKGRWNLPEAIKKTVRNGTLEEELDFKVSYLKQLKTHRRNTCIEYVASCGDIRQVVAQGKSYFNEKSVIKGRKRRRLNPHRGYALQPEYIDDEPKLPDYPAVHFDVYMPSKKDSVMTYNMKYVGRHDDVLITDDDAKLTQNGHSSKAGRSQKRVCRDLDESQFFTADDYFDDEEDNFYDETENEDEGFRRPMSCDLSDLVASAVEKSRLAKGRKDSQKNPRAHRTDFRFCDRKNNVVFLEHEEPEDEANSNFVERPEDLNSKPEMIPITVQIDEMTTEPGNLEEVYGNKYHEAPVFPRKFILDITEAVTVSLKDIVPCKHPDFTSYVVFEEVEEFERFDVYHPFRVSLNSNFAQESVGLETIDDMATYTVQEVVDAAVAYVGILPDESFKTRDRIPSTVYKPARYELTDSVCDWGVEVMEPELAYQKIKDKENQDIPHVVRDPFALSDLCNICFEDIGQRGLSATALKRCQHWFCNDCWRNHLVAKINNGATVITCPAHDCQTEVDDITMFTLTSLSVFQRLDNLRCNITLQKRGWRWCPNAKCGRTFKVGKKGVEDEPAIVSCDCGRAYCNICHDEPHWPASCQLVKNFHEKLVKNRDDRDDYVVIDFKNPKKVQVFTRQCPRCFNIMEKNHGCDHMMCICKMSFCWRCGKAYEPGVTHPYPCKAESLKEIEIEHIKSKHEQTDKVGVSQLYQMALHHHKAKKALPFKSPKSNIAPHLMRSQPSHQNEHVTSKLSVVPLMQICASRVEHQARVGELLRKASNLRWELHNLIEYAAITVDVTMPRSPRRSHCHESLQKLSFVVNRLDMLLQHEACSLKPAEALERLKYHTGMAMEIGAKVIRLLAWKNGEHTCRKKSVTDEN